MRPSFRLLAGGLLVALLLAGSAPAVERQTLLTDDLRLVYLDVTQSYLAPYVAQCFENSMDFQRELWDYAPSERTSVILSDASDTGNAAAGYVPRNSLFVETAPLSFAYETVSANERMNWLMNHELVHIATADRGAGSDLSARKFFRGKVQATDDNPETIFYFYLTTPRYAAPRWFREGIAVFVETWMAGGQGRAQGAWDEMVFRAMVRDDTTFYDPLGLVSEGTRVDFQVEANSYLYGTRFMSYLAYEHSPEQLVDWVGRTEGSKKYYASQFKQVFGRSIAEEWRRWIDFEHEFQQRNLAAIREYPRTAFADLSPRALGSVSRAFVGPAGRKLYAAFNYPGILAHVGAISLDDGTVERIIEVKGPVVYEVTSMTYDPAADRIFYTTDNSEYRDLRSVDPTTGKSERLIKDLRLGELAFSPADQALWGVRHFNGIASLARVAPPYDDWDRVYSWPYGASVYNLDISPDGKLLSASVGEINGRHALKVFEIEALMRGVLEPVEEVDFGTTIPSNFVFSPDGRFLYGSTYYTGVSNIWRYELETDDLQCVTNTDGGFFRPIPLGDDRLIVFRYTGEGFVPAQIETASLEDVNPIVFLGQQTIDKHPQLADWNVGSPAEIDLEQRVTDEGTYHSWKSIGLESIYPVVEGYKDTYAAGLRVNFSDPLSFNQISLTATFSPDDDRLESKERLHLHARFERHDWHAFVKSNDADFYDLFGPTKTSRKGWAVGFGRETNLLRDEPRSLDFEWEAAYYGGLEKLPSYQNINATFDAFGGLSAGLTYRNLRASLGAVDYEKGLKAAGWLGLDWVDNELIPSGLVNFDLGTALPLRHSSVWWRNSVGAAIGDRQNAFASFFFGGFGNNYIDHGEIKRYREFYAFPGVDLNAIGGRNFVKSTIEWNLPPLRFRRVGSPGFYLSWMRTSLFAGGIKTAFDDSAIERKLANAGVQFDFRFQVLSRLQMTVSLGAATAWESDRKRDKEFMASLKILK